MEFNLNHACTVIKACVILNNVCNEKNDEPWKHWLEEGCSRVTRNLANSTADSTDNNNDSSLGNRIRDALAVYFSDQ